MADPRLQSFLGVECSVLGRRWIRRESSERVIQALYQQAGVPELIARVMAARGVTPEGAEHFLNPTLREFLPDPSHLLDMDKASTRLARAVMEGETIAVFGDYDVDGATATALLKQFFEAAGGVAILYIPDRIAEGYGPNPAAMRHLKAEGASVVVAVDCGTTAFEALDVAAEEGLDLVVVDHHRAEPRLPRAVAVVNPNRLDEQSPCGHMAAVGVAFLVAVAVNRSLREAGWYGGVGPERMPDTMRWLDLVALGTVCDMVPLTGVNRALVSQGLKVMAQRGNVGLTALLDLVGTQEKPEAWHLGFVLGPRVNAGGRVGRADLGARLLSTSDALEAATLARSLDSFNVERQEIEAAVLLAAMEQLESHSDGGRTLLFASGEGWHPGVVGIVAGRLKDRYNRPVCVAGIDEGGIAKGSGRSVPGVDLGSAILAARQAGLLISGGGHAMAAGFTVRVERLAEFQTFLTDRIDAVSTGDTTPGLSLDGAVDAGAVCFELVEALRRLGPYGAGNPEPRFVVANARVIRADVVGMGHVRCILAGGGGGRLKAIAFRCVDSALGHALLNAPGTSVHLAGTLRADTWRGRMEAQMIVEDLAPAS
ncbi:MAG: single-stranded-DNA-specific exonuclease RecJ [Alphaproteobacteria bacterium]